MTEIRDLVSELLDTAGWRIIFLAAGALAPIFLIWSVKRDSKLKWAFPYLVLVFILLFSIIVATASPHTENLWVANEYCHRESVGGNTRLPPFSSLIGLHHFYGP